MKDKKIAEEKITLFAAIRQDQYRDLKYFSYKRNVSLAQITREALDDYIKANKAQFLNEPIAEKGHV